MIKDALSYLSPDLEIEGTVTCGGPVRIDAQIQGKIESQQQVNIGSPALIQGPIQAQRVIVNGVVKGDLHISEKADVLSQAEIEGNIYLPQGGLSVAKGSKIEGNLKVGSPNISQLKPMQRHDV